MTRRRWIADEVSGDTAALVGEHAAHLARVLRAEIGQEFDIVAGSEVRRGTITTISNSHGKDRIEFALGRRVDSFNPKSSISAITLALSIFKFDRMEWAIEKCTEVGVARIIPVIASRTDAHLASASAKRQERWRRIARQASEQSRRIAPTEILPPIKLRALGGTDILPANHLTRIVLAETLAGSEGATNVGGVLRSQHNSEVALAIGPEGGWTDDELTWFHKEGWTASSLGDTILRAETAAIVATALALEALRNNSGIIKETKSWDFDRAGG